MGRKIRVDLAAEGGKVGLMEETFVDSSGRPWAAAPVVANDVMVAIELTEIPMWDLAIEGVQLGTALGDDPADAAALALRDAGVNSLPEAVAVRMSLHGAEIGAGNAVMVFTLGGQAYQLEHARFNQEIANSTRWTAARQKNERQITALRDELKSIVEQRQA
jgi:hypothetical protein